jgi:hypothetical protein
MIATSSPPNGTIPQMKQPRSKSSHRRRVFWSVVLITVFGIVCWQVLTSPSFSHKSSISSFINSILSPLNRPESPIDSLTGLPKGYSQVPVVALAAVEEHWLPLSDTVSETQGGDAITADVRYVSFASPSAITVQTATNDSRRFLVSDTTLVHVIDQYTLDTTNKIAGFSYGNPIGTAALTTLQAGSPIRVTFSSTSQDVTPTASTVLIYSTTP